MTPTIRAATAHDRGGIIALIHALNLFEANLSPDRRTDLAAAEECYAAISARIDRDGGALIVADEGGILLGILALTFATDEPFVIPDLRRYGLVTDLVVDEQHRSGGIGRMLLGQAEALTRASGLKRLQISALAANRAALKAYEGFGFSAHMMTMAKDL